MQTGPKILQSIGSPQALAVSITLGRPAAPGLVSPTGYIFLTDADGAYLTDTDGAYLVEPA